MATTIILAYAIPGVPVLANPSDYSFSMPGTAANVATILQGGPTSAYSSGAENDAPFVEAVRLWCNFADGLVFKTLANPPVVGYWQGDDTLPAPGGYISTTFRTLNEWMPVNTPLIRDPSTVGTWGGMSCFPFGDLSFLTKTIATSYAGSQPIFEFQWLVRGGIW